jgi:hypothetical protein
MPPSRNSKCRQVVRGQTSGFYLTTGASSGVGESNGRRVDETPRSRQLGSSVTLANASRNPFLLTMVIARINRIAQNGSLFLLFRCHPSKTHVGQNKNGSSSGRSGACNEVVTLFWLAGQGPQTRRRICAVGRSLHTCAQDAPPRTRNHHRMTLCLRPRLSCRAHAHLSI